MDKDNMFSARCLFYSFSSFPINKKRIATIAIAPVKDKPKYSHATYTNNNKVYENVIANDKAF